MSKAIYDAATAARKLGGALEALGNAGGTDASNNNIRRLWSMVNEEIDQLELALQEAERVIEQELGEAPPQPEPNPDPVITEPDPEPVRKIKSKDELIWPDGVDHNHYLGMLKGDSDPGHNRPLPKGLRWKDTGELVSVTAEAGDPSTGPDVGIPVPTPEISERPIDVRTENDTDWLSSGWLDNVEQFVREDARSEEGDSVFVLYDAPDRDNGNYSAGGVATLEKYKRVVEAVSSGIADDRALVIIEPDALGLLQGLPADRRMLRLQCIEAAVQIFDRNNPNTRSYVDASMWIPPAEMNQLFKAVGAKGFAINTSGWESLEECYRYGDELAKISGLTYVIDVSRNGRGNPHKPAWCNVTDTMVGPPPTTKTASKYCDALIWAKIPGQSDGRKINGYDDDGQTDRLDVPRAGEEWPEFREAIYSGNWAKFKKKYKV